MAGKVVESLDGGISEEMTEETVCIYREWLGEAIKVRRNHEAE